MDELTEARRTTAPLGFFDGEGESSQAAAKYGLAPSLMSYLSQPIAASSSAFMGRALEPAQGHRFGRRRFRSRALPGIGN